MTKEYSGLFVVLEGIDGSGTSIQTILLHDYIKRLENYYDVLTTHEPWHNDEINRKLREESDAYSGGEEMTRLFVNDRINHLQRLIIPNLNQGTTILCDRYSMSTYAYQGTQGVSFKKIKRIHEEEGILMPDLTLFLDADYETARERVARRGESLEKFETNEKFTKELIRMYRTLSEIEKVFGKVVTIDARKSIEDVHAKIVQEFDKLCGGKN